MRWEFYGGSWSGKRYEVAALARFSPVTADNAADGALAHVTTTIKQEYLILEKELQSRKHAHCIGNADRRQTPQKREYDQKTAALQLAQHARTSDLPAAFSYAILDAAEGLAHDVDEPGRHVAPLDRTAQELVALTEALLRAAPQSTWASTGLTL